MARHLGRWQLGMFTSVDSTAISVLPPPKHNTKVVA
jgi:hypothetical protein